MKVQHKADRRNSGLKIGGKFSSANCPGGRTFLDRVFITDWKVNGSSKYCGCFARSSADVACGKLNFKERLIYLMNSSDFYYTKNGIQDRLF